MGPDSRECTTKLGKVSVSSVVFFPSAALQDEPDYLRYNFACRDCFQVGTEKISCDS